MDDMNRASSHVTRWGRAILLGGALLLLPACAMMNAPTGTIARDTAARSDDWRDVATPRDRERIRGWWTAWTDALASARGRGHGQDILDEGVLLDPQAALPNPHIPPGDYDCRVIKLGTPTGNTLAFVSYTRFRCRVAAEQDIFSFTKITGSQRPVGLLFDDTDRRKIFLGTLALGDETRAMDYGTDADRDMAGLLERIGPERWRMVLPRPAFESIVDVIEITPVVP